MCEHSGFFPSFLKIMINNTEMNIILYNRFFILLNYLLKMNTHKRGLWTNGCALFLLFICVTKLLSEEIAPPSLLQAVYEHFCFTRIRYYSKCKVNKYNTYLSKLDLCNYYKTLSHTFTTYIFISEEWFTFLPIHSNGIFSLKDTRVSRQSLQLHLYQQEGKEHCMG